MPWPALSNTKRLYDYDKYGAAIGKTKLLMRALEMSLYVTHRGPLMDEQERLRQSLRLTIESLDLRAVEKALSQYEAQSVRRRLTRSEEN